MCEVFELHLSVEVSKVFSPHLRWELRSVAPCLVAGTSSPGGVEPRRPGIPFGRPESNLKHNTKLSIRRSTQNPSSTPSHPQRAARPLTTQNILKSQTIWFIIPHIVKTKNRWNIEPKQTPGAKNNRQRSQTLARNAHAAMA